jgi:hypothetical protein
MTITGRITGWFMVGGSLGAMSLPWLIGQLIERIGPHALPLIILTALILTLGVLAVLVRYPPIESTSAVLNSSQ